MSEFLPRAAHSYFTFNIRQNMARFGTAAANFAWTVANAGTLEQYNEAMAALRRISPKAYAYLDKIPKEHWVRAFFPLPRYGHVTSNIAESMNSVLRDCWKRPPMTLFVKVVRKITANFAEKRERYAAGNATDIVETVFAELVANTDAGRQLVARSVF